MAERVPVDGPAQERSSRARERGRGRSRSRSRSRDRSPPRRRPRRPNHPARSVMVFPTRDGDHIVVTVTVGKLI